MSTSTPNFNWILPAVNDPVDANLWGGQLNSNLSSQDTTFAAAGITSAGLLKPADNVFSIKGSVDDTKLIAFDASAIATGTTRTATMPDKSGTLAMTSDLPVNRKEEFTTSGTFTTPSNITSDTVFKVTITGAGAASNFAVAGSGRGGAGAGATAIKYVSGLSPSTGYAIVIGVAPAGYSGSNGGNSTATFDSLVITAGGGIAPVGPPDNVPGSGGTATNGDINIPGGNGCPGVVGTNGVGGQGGASYWGGGPSAGYAASVGTGTTGAPGSGASGLAASGYGGGGFGFNGICVIEWIS